MLANTEIRDIMKENKSLEKRNFIEWTINNLCGKQVKQTNIFRSYRTNQVFKSFLDVTIKSENLIYLLLCQICKLQCLEKSETNLHLNNPRRDAKSKKSILACKHLSEPNLNFQQHVQLILMCKLWNK